jgi:hypothetical protein
MIAKFFNYTSRTSLVLSLVLASSCKKMNESRPESTKQRPPFDIVFAQCFAPQGNGGNWAATLSWVSEQINVRVQEANSLSQQGKRVGLYLGCMTGGSSGSVTTAVLSSVLSNKNILPTKSAQDILSPEEATLVARALRYVAFSVDLNLRELVLFFGQALWTQGSNFINQNALQPLIEKLFGKETPHWWKGATVDPSKILVDFAATVHLASTLTPELINKTISSALSGAELKAYESRAVKLVHELPEFSSMDEVTRLSNYDFDSFSKGLEKQTQFIGQASDSFVARQFALGDYARRHLADLSRNGGNYKLKTTIDTPLAEGLCTITMAALKRKKEDLQTLPMYPSLTPVVFCDQRTIRKILSSALYRQHVQSGHPYASRYVLAVVPSIRGALVPSIREPNMMVPLRSPLSGGELEVREFYYPAWDKEKNGAFTFSLMNAGKVQIGQTEFAPQLGVAGGFPDRRVSAWMISYFLFDTVKQQLASQAGEVRTVISLFGRDNKRSAQAFHKDAVQKVFSPSEQEGSRNLNDWMSFTDAYCDTMATHLQTSFQGKIENVVVDWEVSRLPAAQQPGGASRLLVVRSTNATRSQTIHPTVPMKLVFDPLVKTEGSSTSNGTNPCKEQ